MGKIIDVCLSEKKGVQKKRIDEGIFIEDFGLQGDAHAGKWHRQVSLLSYEKVVSFNELGAGVDSGAFGENLVVEGYDYSPSIISISSPGFIVPPCITLANIPSLGIIQSPIFLNISHPLHKYEVHYSKTVATRSALQCIHIFQN